MEQAVTWPEFLPLIGSAVGTHMEGCRGAHPTGILKKASLIEVHGTTSRSGRHYCGFFKWSLSTILLPPWLKERAVGFGCEQELSLLIRDLTIILGKYQYTYQVSVYWYLYLVFWFSNTDTDTSYFKNVLIYWYFSIFFLISISIFLIFWMIW